MKISSVIDKYFICASKYLKAAERIEELVEENQKLRFELSHLQLIAERHSPWLEYYQKLMDGGCCNFGASASGADMNEIEKAQKLALKAERRMLDSEKRLYWKTLELADIKSLAKEMFRAEDEYGCGFYNEDSWCDKYELLKRMSGYEANTKD